MWEYFETAFEYAVHHCQRYAVVGEGNSLVFGIFPPVDHLTLVQHTASAVDDQLVRGEVLGEFTSRRKGDIYGFTRSLFQQCRQFHASDIAALTVMSTALRDKHSVAVL